MRKESAYDRMVRLHKKFTGTDFNQLGKNAMKAKVEILDNQQKIKEKKHNIEPISSKDT